MLERFLSYINQKKILKKEDRILLAISGGIDSMVMLDLFMQSEWTIAVGHINHHLRATESDGDAEFIQNFCASHNISYYQLDLDATQLIQGNMHANARTKRYDWLKKIALENEFQYIAAAHHQDDETETFMINLIRGSGLDGLDGIDFLNENIIRPMLFATKEEISTFAQVKGILYREDSSNQKDKYLRNYLRHHVMPSIHKADHRAKEGIQSSIKNLKSSKILLDFLVDKFAQNIIEFKEIEIHISLTEISRTGVGDALLFQYLKNYGYNHLQCKNIIKAINQTGNMFYSNDYEALINRNQLIVRPLASKSSQVFETIHEFPFILNAGKFKFTLDYAPTPTSLEKEADTLWIDCEHIQFPLNIRNWQEGDIFAPLGMKGKRQKVKDYLINRKVNKFEKEDILVLTNADNIIAVLMEGISEQSRLKNTTTTCLMIKKWPLA